LLSREEEIYLSFKEIHSPSQKEGECSSRRAAEGGELKGIQPVFFDAWEGALVLKEGGEILRQERCSGKLSYPPEGKEPVREIPLEEGGLLGAPPMGETKKNYLVDLLGSTRR